MSVLSKTNSTNRFANMRINFIYFAPKIWQVNDPGKNKS